MITCGFNNKFPFGVWAKKKTATYISDWLNQENPKKHNNRKDYSSIHTMWLYHTYKIIIVISTKKF